jgi:adenosine deaminase
MGCLVDARAYGAVAGAVFRDLAAQNVRYAEISFDIVGVLDRGLAVADVAGAIEAAAPPGLLVRVFAAFSQHKPERTPSGVMKAVLDAPGLDGISLHGDETVQSTAYFADAFAAARRRGLAIKAHAGELMGPESVTKVLDLLGVRRIEHGVRAIEDEALVERLAAEAVTLDVCPWSNVRLRVVPDLAGHPIRQLHERGVRVTVNTDDPTVFGRSLSRELVSLVEDLGFSLAELARLQANAFAVAAMPAAVRAAVLGEIEALVQEIAPGRA